MPSKLNPDDATPLARILAQIQKNVGDQELPYRLDAEALALWWNLESIAANVKNVGNLEPQVDADFDLNAMLERLGDTAVAFSGNVTRQENDDDNAATGVFWTLTRRSSPKALGEYDLFEPIGRGGSGTVYRAQHRKLRRKVAIKLLNKINDKRSIARFQQEMRAIGSLQHPNVVAATDAGEADGVPYLVMEWIQGESVAQLIQTRGPMPVPEACEIIRQAATGLQAIHEHRLVHRDIKPANLMVTSSGHVKILDLGLALLHEQDLSHGAITSSGIMMGTVDFIAPEQAEDTHKVDIRADIYSLGATFYLLLTGVPPFGPSVAASPLAKITAIATGKPIPIADRRPELPTALVAVINRMLARYPEERFATPQEVVQVLSPYCDDLMKVTSDVNYELNLSDHKQFNGKLAQKSEHRVNWIVVALVIILLVQITITYFGFF